jgi:hypothetical protein
VRDRSRYWWSRSFPASKLLRHFVPVSRNLAIKRDEISRSNGTPEISADSLWGRRRRLVFADDRPQETDDLRDHQRRLFRPASRHLGCILGFSPRPRGRCLGMVTTDDVRRQARSCGTRRIPAAAIGSVVARPSRQRLPLFPTWSFRWSRRSSPSVFGGDRNDRMGRGYQGRIPHCERARRSWWLDRRAGRCCRWLHAVLEFRLRVSRRDSGECPVSVLCGRQLGSAWGMRENDANNPDLSNLAGGRPLSEPAS